MDTHHFDTAKGLGAVAFNAIALVTSAQEHFEWALRCLSLCAGIAVALVTIASIRKGRRDRE